MRLEEALEKGFKVAVRFQRFDDESKFCKFTFSKNDGLTHALDYIVGSLDYLGEPTEERPYAYEKTLVVVDIEGMRNMGYEDPNITRA